MGVKLVKIKSIVHKLLEKGFFHIFIGNTLVKCVSLCSAILLPRILVPESVYGILTTVDNFNSYLILINGMGLANSVLRYCSMKQTQLEKTAIFRFCLKVGLIADGLLISIYVPILIFSTMFSVGNYGIAKPYILISCLIPVLTYAQDVFMIYMRSNLLNKEYSKVSVIYTILYAGFQVVLAYFASLKGVFVGRYIALSITLAICYWILSHKKVIVSERIDISRKEKKTILVYAIGAMITNALSLVMPLNETLVVNLVLKDLSSTAYYKAASMLPSNLQYISTSVVVFIFPYFAQHTGNGIWIEKNLKKVVMGMCAIMIPIIIVGYMLSPEIILLIYGENYAPAISIMRPMWIAFGINAIIRVPVGNILAALGELRFNIVLSIFVSILHLILDYLFISQIGIGGSAYALMIVYSVSSIASLLYVLMCCKKRWCGKN